MVGGVITIAIGVLFVLLAVTGTGAYLGRPRYPPPPYAFKKPARIYGFLLGLAAILVGIYLVWR